MTVSRGELDAARARGWEAAERMALEIDLAATPVQRLEWLEEAVALAVLAGVYPQLPDQARSYPRAEAERIDRDRWGGAHLSRRGPVTEEGK